MNMNRAQFLRWSGLGALTLALDPLSFLMAWGAPRHWPIVVLIELQGGNDGLNTLVPYADPAYARLRPKLALPREQVLQLNHELGLHPALKALWPLWKKQQLAWVTGVGYAEPNRSHFRSIEIWEQGSDARQIRDRGWLSDVLKHQPGRVSLAADGGSLGGALGPLAGPELRTLVLNRQGQLPRLPGAEHAIRQDTPALQHVLAVERQAKQASLTLADRLQQAPPLPAVFPPGAFAQQLAQVARLIRAETPLTVYTLSLGSFDTHRAQLGTHARLLGELANGLLAFQQALEPEGHWQRVLVMTYSEFGRRAAENASGGTDHGTAAPHLVLGGRVKGGIYGRQPALTQLVNGDLAYSVDYRSLYQTLVRRWWGSSVNWAGRDFPLLGFL